MNQINIISDMTNQEFLSQYARAGRIGLAGGDTLIDKAIARAQRHLDDQARWGKWSHAFFFQGTRSDGHAWVIESDLQIHRKHLQFGAQENRASKFHDEHFYTRLAVLDFGIDPPTCAKLVSHGLDLVASHAKYSFRELAGTLVALRHPSLRQNPNVLARSTSFYCSAFVEHIFRLAGLSLVEQLDVKNTTPEDIFRSWRPHAAYVLERPVAAKTRKVVAIAKAIRRRVTRSNPRT